MAVVPKEDGQLVPVTQCKTFMEDPTFEEVRKLANQPGGGTLCDYQKY